MAPDVYLSVNSNGETSEERQAMSTIETGKCLDNAFIAPEMLFQKFNQHTSSLDVFGFGMVMFSVMFGKVPESYYHLYRDWLRSHHNKDVEDQESEAAELPFIPPNADSFIFDPFSANMNKVNEPENLRP